MALNEFISRVGSTGVARQNRFKVSFKPPAALAADRNVDLVTETISMPGQNIRSVPDDLRFGPAREQAQGVTYGPFSATFICTPGLPEKVFFEDWQDLVFNKGENEWQVKFYKDYVGTVKIHQLDRRDLAKYLMTVHEAYPKTINEQSFSLGSNDAYQTVTVEFTYRWWERSVLPWTAPPAPVDTFDAFSGGRGAREVRAVDTFIDVHRTALTTAADLGTASQGEHQPGTNPEHPGKPF